MSLSKKLVDLSLMGATTKSDGRSHKLLDCAVPGNRTLSGLTEVARAALAEVIKKSA
jgi:hypothetical protein